MTAIIDEDINGVKFFINTNSQSINQKNIGGATALHIASRIGNLEIVKLLVENGADVNVSDNENMTPLMRASIGGFEEIVKLLLQYRANASVLSSNNKSVIYYSTFSSCANCLNNLFESYDFKTNMPKIVLNKQLSSSYQIARNRDDSVIQKILEDYLNKDVIGAKRYSFSVDNEGEIIEESSKSDEGKFTYVVDVDQNGEVAEFTKIPEISISKENLPNLSVSNQDPKIEQSKVKYRLKIGESAKKPNEENYLIVADKETIVVKELEKQSEAETQVKAEKDKIFLYKIKKVQEDKKIQTKKDVKKFEENKEKLYNFISGKEKSEVKVENKVSTKPESKISYQPMTNGDDEFLKSFKKVFLFKPVVDGKSNTAKEVNEEIIKNKEKIEDKKNYIFKQKVSSLEKNGSGVVKDNQNLSSNNQHFYYDDNTEIGLLSENNNSKRYFFIPNI